MKAKIHDWLVKRFGQHQGPAVEGQDKHRAGQAISNPAHGDPELPPNIIDRMLAEWPAGTRFGPNRPYPVPP